MTSTRTTFDTREFFSSHFREPRGRGSWGFLPETADRDDLDAVIWVPGSRTFTDARSWVRRNCEPGHYRVCS